jgi:GR25 family glycosyltransferase involved in LPS biosynthesis
MPVTLLGTYINLDRSPERDAFMRAQLARLGMGWVRRQSAVDGAQLALPQACSILPGEYACLLSHLQAIEGAPDDAFVLVLEDDTELSEQLPDLLARALQGPLAAVDICFLECQTHFSLAHVHTLWETACRHLVETDGPRRASGIELLDARPFYRWGCPAYVVSPAGRVKLRALMRAWLQQGPGHPLDVAMEQAIRDGQLRGVITIPYLATTGLQWHGQSTIGNTGRLPPDLLMVLRRILFAGPLGDAEALAGPHVVVPPDDPTLRLLAPVLLQVAAFQRVEQQRARPGSPPPPG